MKSSFCETMRAAVRPAWDAIVGHRFFREIASDALPNEVFARYLRIEYGFVDTAAAVLGFAVAKAPSFAERRRLALNLHGLVTDQHEFFVAAFARIGASSVNPIGQPRSGGAAALHRHFLDVARDGSYEEILACLLGAEWMYLTWCRQASATPSARPAIRDWVDLHAGGDFAAGVHWLLTELDARGPALSATRQTRLREVFEGALTAEVAFHTAAYDQAA
jgi:thiaminase/transcriptional activator TenA